MAEEQSLNSFYASFRSDLLCADDEDCSPEMSRDLLTFAMLERLEEAGEAEHPVMCPYQVRSMQTDAYVISDDFKSVDLFVTVYMDSPVPATLPRADASSAIERGAMVFQKALSGDLRDCVSDGTDIAVFADAVFSRRDTIRTGRIVLLTNGVIDTLGTNTAAVGGVEITSSCWDISRLYRLISSGKTRETIEIDLQEDGLGGPLPCVRSVDCGAYTAYLTILNGETLARLFRKYGSTLLERNVRSFLQMRGPVNRGIRDTLRDEPEMFLAFNNGLSATAESVETVTDGNGQLCISRIRDLQVVNGGQTMVSIYRVSTDRKTAGNLKRVYVQMKLSVISSCDRMDQIVPRISECANTQNTVQTADFSANELFHRRIEELSRMDWWSPETDDQHPRFWFYERSRGQYEEEMNREKTPKQRRVFKETHILFTKTELAKCVNTWDQRPYEVSEGAQKNFRKFTDRLMEAGYPLPDTAYFERTVAETLLFRRTEELVSAQRLGGYRANIVTYTVALLSERTGKRVDLPRIWKEQGLTEALEQDIIRFARAVRPVLVKVPAGGNVTEWCKKPACWEAVKALDCDISDELRAELLTEEQAASENETGGEKLDDDAGKIVEEVCEIPASTWHKVLSWAKKNHMFRSWECSVLFVLGRIREDGRTPTLKQCTQGLKIYREAASMGFRQGQ